MAINAAAIPEELRKLKQWVEDHFTYDPLTGVVSYKLRDFGNNPTPRQKQWNTRFANKPAGYFNGNYFKVSLSGKSLYVHQVAFAIMAGYIPLEIEHQDKNKTNNIWTNLRDALSHSNNSSNVNKRVTNKSGFKGVSWAKRNNCWRMDIQSKGIKYYSYHSTPEEAHETYKLMSNELHGDFGSHE